MSDECISHLSFWKLLLFDAFVEIRLILCVGNLNLGSITLCWSWVFWVVCPYELNLYREFSTMCRKILCIIQFYHVSPYMDSRSNWLLLSLYYSANNRDFPAVFFNEYKNTCELHLSNLCNFLRQSIFWK